MARAVQAVIWVAILILAALAYWVYLQINPMDSWISQEDPPAHSPLLPGPPGPPHIARFLVR